MQKWGKHRNGKQRYRCINCGISETKNRLDITQKYRFELFKEWILGDQHLDDLALKYNVTSRTLQNWFTNFWVQEIEFKNQSINGLVVLVDALYLEKGCCLLIAKTKTKIIYFDFVISENYITWKCFLEIWSGDIPLAFVCDGKAGLLKAIREIFPLVIIQRCHFHVISYVRRQLTLNPKLQPSKELKIITRAIKLVKNDSDLKLWSYLLNWWEENYLTFIKQRTYGLSLTPTGRFVSYYTHANLHSAYYHLKRALPNLFEYLTFSDIPNTNNSLEGGTNSQLREVFKKHRGLPLIKRKFAASFYLLKEK
jgi:Transposase and inactivated derivatives